MAEVTLKNVYQTFGADIPAVSDVSFEVADREFLVLAGPAGCGKSTILRMIAGFEAIERGEILIGNKLVNDLAPKERDVAMVFQEDALYPHMSVHENLAFGLKLRKFPKAEISRRVRDSAEVLGIEDLLEQRPATLSRGQRQRVALARAIVRQPKVFLFDAPLSNLDANTGLQLRAEITKLHQRLQTTTIYATRDPAEAMIMGDRVVVLDQGAVQQIDAPQHLYKQPTNLSVAGFFGSPPMNFINGTLKTDRDGFVFNELEGGTIQVRFSAGVHSEARAYLGQPMVLGIRPEDIGIAEQAKSAAVAAFPAIVDVVEPMGSETRLYLQTGAHSVTCRTQLPIERTEMGRRMRFEINVDHVHLFDPVTTNRIF